MATDPNVWDAQIARLLTGYREPSIDAGRMEEMGRRIAGRLREAGLLEANLESLVPRYQEPSVDASRLERIGLELSGLLREQPLRPARPRAPRSPADPRGGAGFVWAAAAVAAGLLILLSVTQSPPSRPVRQAPPIVATPPAPKTEAPIPGPAERTADPPSAPAPERTVTVVPPRDPGATAPPSTAAPAAKPVPDLPPPPPARLPAETVAAPVTGEVARLERIEGTVEIAAGEGGARTIAVSGQELLPLAFVETAAKGGRALLKYPDGTTLDLEPGSTLQVLAPPSGAKELSLGRGALGAKVSPQPAGKPLILLTPQAETRVLGTQFSLSAESQSSRLEVREGKVRFTRRSDGATVDVGAGHFAVASRGVALLTRPIPDEPKTMLFDLEEFGSARGTRPADGMVRRIFLEPFDTAAGGWCVSAPIAGMDVTGELKLAKGAWYLWIRYRDEPGNTKIGFNVIVGEQVVGQASTPGRDRGWVWKRFPIAWGGGTARITLRSTVDGVKAPPDRADFRQSPYGALNRWDRLCVTPDESFVPE